MKIFYPSLIGLSLSLSSYSPALAQSDIIIVSAQKREGNIKDVPISISTFDSETLNMLGVTSLDQVTSITPGAELFDDRGAGQPTWVIRGAGLVDFNSNNTPTTAIYYDDVYLVSNALGGIGLFDVERVEVLKGPQGGLYGRNTTGGAVQVISSRPDLNDYQGYAQASYGQWNRWGIEGAVGGPIISDKLAFRVSAKTDQNGGWQDSLATPFDDEHGDRDYNAFRGQLLFQPNPKLDITFKADIGSDNSETSLGRSVGAYDALTGDFCGPIRLSQRNDSECFSLSNILGDPRLPSEQSENGSIVLSNPINRVNNDWSGYTLNLNYDLGFADLVSVSSVLDFNYIQFFDFDATPLELVSSTNSFPDIDSDIKQWSQDLHIASKGDSAFTWLLGAGYAQDSIRQIQSFSLAGLEPIFNLNFISTDFVQNTSSASIYAEVGYDITEAFNLNGSLRYTDEDKDIQYSSFAAATEVDVFPILTDIVFQESLESNFSGHLGLNWKINNQNLLYAKYSKSFKSGGFFGAFTDNPGGLRPYQEETNDAFEIGLKSHLSDQLKLDLSAFYYNYKDVQGFASVENALFGNITELTNIGDAEHIGVEINSVWTPSPIPGFSLQFSGAWLEAQITESSLRAATQDDQLNRLEGLDRNFAPQFSFFINIEQKKKISENYLGSLSASYNWRDNLVTNSSQLSELDFGLFRHDAYGLLNLRASLTNENQNWELSLLGENVTNEIYTTRATTDDGGSYQDILGRPASWKIQARYEF